MAKRKSDETYRQQKGSKQPRPVGSQKALPAPKGKSPVMQHRVAKAGSARSQQRHRAQRWHEPACRSREGYQAFQPTKPEDMLSTLKESVRQAKAKKKAS